MKLKCTDAESPISMLKDESARQRWELFHRAIAHAKQSTIDSLADPDDGGSEQAGGSPALTIVR